MTANNIAANNEAWNTLKELGLKPGDVVWERGTPYRIERVVHGLVELEAVSVAQRTRVTPADVGELLVQHAGGWTGVAERAGVRA